MSVLSHFFPFRVVSLVLIVYLSILLGGGKTLLASYKTSVFDTPTAISLEKGEYSVESFFYGDGGILLKMVVGLSPFINLGAIEYVDHLIGNKEPVPSIPSVSARIRFTDQPLDSYNFAIGFDSLYHGTFHPLNSKLFGAYFVYTQGFIMLNAPQFFSMGVRQPLLYEIIEPDIFVSLYLNFFEYFNYAIEIDNVHFVNQYKYHFILNQAFIFRPVQELGLAFNLQMGLTQESDPERKPRVIFSKEFRIFYQSFF